MVELLFADYAGERFERIRKGTPLVVELPWAARTDRVAVVIDGGGLAPGGSPETWLNEAKRQLKTERTEAEQRTQVERADLEQRYHKLLQEHMSCGLTIAKLEAQVAEYLAFMERFRSSLQREEHG